MLANVTRATVRVSQARTAAAQGLAALGAAKHPAHPGPALLVLPIHFGRAAAHLADRGSPAHASSRRARLRHVVEQTARWLAERQAPAPGDRRRLSRARRGHPPARRCVRDPVRHHAAGQGHRQRAAPAIASPRRARRLALGARVHGRRCRRGARPRAPTWTTARSAPLATSPTGDGSCTSISTPPCSAATYRPSSASSPTWARSPGICKRSS